MESLLRHKGKVKLPSHHSKEELAEKFNNFSISKITKIRDDLDSFSTTMTTDNQIASTTAESEHKHGFTPATKREICEIISALPPKSCDSDPIPT